MQRSDSKLKLTLLSVINAALILACVAGCVYILISGSGLYYSVSAAAELLALVFSVMYYLRGYNKDAAKYFRMFMLFYACTYIAETLATVLGYDDLGVISDVSESVVFSMILFGNTLVLALGKDLGTRVSYTLCLINAAFYALPIIGLFIPGMINFETEQIKAASIILYCTWFVLSLNAFIMTVAKYKDKAARGSE